MIDKALDEVIQDLIKKNEKDKKAINQEMYSEDLLVNY